MNIIHILVGLGGGGAEHFVLELSKQNKLRNYKVGVAAITPKSNIAYKFTDNGIPIYPLNINKPYKVFSGFKKLLDLLYKNQDAVVHGHMFHAVMLASLAKLFVPSIRIVFTLHTNHVKQYYRRLFLYLTRGLRSADVIFSADSRRWYHRKDAVVIPNGIDPERFKLSPEPPEVFTCLFLGRMEEPKNPLYLVDLVLKLKDKHRFRINIAGEGHLIGELKSRIAEHEIEDYFNFLGFRTDIPEILSKAHCMIMPSLWEGMPISILEAGVAGIPVISTPVGSIPSILNDENAYVGELDNFHLMVEDVLCNYEVARQKAGKLKKLILEEYNIHSSARKHHKIYEGITQSEKKNQTLNNYECSSNTKIIG